MDIKELADKWARKSQFGAQLPQTEEHILEFLNDITAFVQEQGLVKFTLLPEEEVIWNEIKRFHNQYLELPIQHPSDQIEWSQAIHTLQQLLGLRILRRAIPTLFTTIPR